MKLGVVGSRTFNDYNRLSALLDVIHSKKGITLIVSGGAKGADSLSEKWADEHNVKKLILVPDWDKFGKKAGYLRNVDIVENSDGIVAFWDGISKGTKHSIDLCEKNKKPCKILYF